MGKMLSLRQFVAQVAELTEATTVIKREPDGTQRTLGTWVPEEMVATGLRLHTTRMSRPPDPESQMLVEDRPSPRSEHSFGKSRPAPKP